MLNKRNFQREDAKFSYLLEKACRYCNAPIPDGEHATRDFCPVSYDMNGQVRDCKTSYHREQDKTDREQIAKLNADQKSITTRIEYLIKTKGYEILVKDLENCTINLSKCLDFSIAPNGIFTSIFLKHTIVVNPFNNIAKILHND